jgi:hypothetical protein
MSGEGVDKGRGGITSYANVTNCFYILIITKGEGSGIGSTKDTRGGGLKVGGGR